MERNYVRDCCCHGKYGNHTMGVPVECNLCLFWNVCGRDPVWKDPNDQFTLMAIQGVNLDVMREGEPNTVGTNWRCARADYLASAHMPSLEETLPVLGIPIVGDMVGMDASLMALMTSL